jgi:hypothetical protein
MTHPSRPPGITALCFFFLFGTVMSGLKKVHGIASAHGPVAIVTAAAFGLAVMSVSLKF